MTNNYANIINFNTNNFDFFQKNDYNLVKLISKKNLIN